MTPAHGMATVLSLLDPWLFVTHDHMLVVGWGLIVTWLVQVAAAPRWPRLCAVCYAVNAGCTLYLLLSLSYDSGSHLAGWLLP